MLRRTEVSPFDCDKLYSIEEIEQLSKEKQLEEILLPIDSALPNQPKITLNSEEAGLIQNGVKVSRENIPNAPLIRLYLENGEFIGLGYYASDGRLAPKRLMRTN